MATATSFHVTISTVAGALYDGNALSLSVPGSEGNMVVLAQHEPLVALLKTGMVSLKTESNEIKTFEVSKGVLEVSNNKAIVLI